MIGLAAAQRNNYRAKGPQHRADSIVSFGASMLDSTSSGSFDAPALGAVAKIDSSDRARCSLTAAMRPACRHYYRR